MIKPEGKRFLYRAHAVGAAGSFRKPYTEYVDAQASCALAITGGVASSCVRDFSYRNIMSFSLAESSILGQPGETEGVYTTLSTVTLEDFNVMNMITADRIVARLSSRTYSDRQEAAFLAIGSHFDNLRVAGQPVSMDLDGDILAKWETYEQARAGYQEREHIKIPDHQLICRSIVYNVSEPSGTKVTGNRIDIPHFGSVYLGEIYVLGKSRRVVMMRIAFGCPVDGDGSAGDVENNGEPYPPLAG